MRSTWIWTGLALLAISGGAYALYAHLRPVPLPDTLVYGNGHVEGTEIRVAAEVSGRVVENAMTEGASVKAGTLLARIESTELELRREKAQAEINAIEAESQRVKEELRTWRHHLETAENDLERYRTLRSRGNVAPQRLEQAENTFQEARAQVGTQQARLDELAARREAARKALAIIENEIAKTRIVSPIAGTILVKGVEKGEFVRPGRVVAVLVDLSDMELKVFVPEKVIGKIKLDDPARVRVDAFPDRTFTARVARVDQQAQFTPRDIHMPEERVRMVFGVTLEIEDSGGALKPGMPADAWILWKDGVPWPERLFVPQ